MKKILIFLFSLQIAVVYSQDGNLDLTKSYSQGYGVIGLNASGMMESYDATGKRIPSNNQIVSGNKMLSNDFVFGVVKLKDQENKVSLLVNFSLYNNLLLFKKDSLMLTFANPVEEFSMLVKEEGINKAMTFKSGYPKIGTNTESSFYQVVTDGPKIQLLKYIYKTVQDKFSYNGPVQREYAYRENFYLYDAVKKTITEIKPSVKSISKSNPELTASIERYAIQNKVKNEEDLKGWVVSLNENNTNKK